MWLVADIHVHDLAHDALERQDLLKCRQRWEDRPEHGHVLIGEAVRGARGEGEAVMHAVRQHDRDGDVVRVAGSLKGRDDVIGVIRRVGEPGEDPIIKAMGFREGAPPARVGAAFVRVDVFSRGAAKFPNARIGSALGMP
jgi:hypothetical protein